MKVNKSGTCHNLEPAWVNPLGEFPRQQLILELVFHVFFAYFVYIAPISQSINPNHLLRLFSAGILWCQLLASLLSFVQICCRLIQEDTAAAVVSLWVSSQLWAAPSYHSISTMNQVFHHTNLPFLPLLRSSPLISITSSSFKVASFVWWLKLWRSLLAFRYSIVHLFHRMSLYFRTYLARFLRS